MLRPGQERGRHRRLLSRLLRSFSHHGAQVERFDPRLRLADVLGELAQIIAIGVVERQPRAEAEDDVARRGLLAARGDCAPRRLGDRLGPRLLPRRWRRGERPRASDRRDSSMSRARMSASDRRDLIEH